MSEASFHRAISDHLALSQRNKRLERVMPLDRYREETPPRGTPEPGPATAGEGHWLDPDSSWDTTLERPLPEFDWGDD